MVFTKDGLKPREKIYLVWDEEGLWLFCEDGKSFVENSDIKVISEDTLAKFEECGITKDTISMVSGKIAWKAKYLQTRKTYRIFILVHKSIDPETARRVINELPIPLIILDEFHNWIESLYPAPTVIAHIAHHFGERKFEKKELVKPYRGEPYIKCVYLTVYDTPTQLNLPISNDNDIDEQFRKLVDPLGLRVFHAILHECYRQKNHEVWININTIADLMGYKRDKKGYHQTRNIRQIKSRLIALSKVGHNTKFTRGNETVEISEPLLKIQDDITALYTSCTNRIKKIKIRVSEQYYKDMLSGKYAWFSSRFLQIDSRRYSRAVLLYHYYAMQYGMSYSQREDKTSVSRPLETILRETGIVIDKKHPQRSWKKFEEAHVHLKEIGLIKDYRFYNDKIIVTFPEVFLNLNHRYHLEKTKKVQK